MKYRNEAQSNPVERALKTATEQRKQMRCKDAPGEGTKPGETAGSLKHLDIIHCKPVSTRPDAPIPQPQRATHRRVVPTFDHAIVRKSYFLRIGFDIVHIHLFVNTTKVFQYPRSMHVRQFYGIVLSHLPEQGSLHTISDVIPRNQNAEPN